jgi:hypothetical protein
MWTVDHLLSCLCELLDCHEGLSHEMNDFVFFRANQWKTILQFISLSLTSLLGKFSFASTKSLDNYAYPYSNPFKNPLDGVFKHEHTL